MKSKFYNKYSDYLKERYGEKVYKLPVNLPVTCPNRVDGQKGCAFCAECGTGFEAMSSHIPVAQQLIHTREVIEKKYHAHKFIAYFQNYTNTFLPVADFEQYVSEAAEIPDIVGVHISTRPDCIRREYLEVLKKISEEKKIDITIELGLQTVNYRTLQRIGRGHGMAEFIDAVLTIREYDFPISAHVILNLPGDDLADNIETAKTLSALRIHTVKIHSLYIAKNTRLCEEYENGTIAICEKNEYIQRLVTFIDYLDPDIIVERLFSRVPEQDAVFSNWGTSWWKLQDEVMAVFEQEGHYQGKLFHYLNGAALDKL